jgi:hypothetical protein
VAVDNTVAKTSDGGRQPRAERPDLRPPSATVSLNRSQCRRSARTWDRRDRAHDRCREMPWRMTRNKRRRLAMLLPSWRGPATPAIRFCQILA